MEENLTVTDLARATELKMPRVHEVFEKMQKNDLVSTPKDEQFLRKILAKFQSQEIPRYYPVSKSLYDSALELFKESRTEVAASTVRKQFNLPTKAWRAFLKISKDGRNAQYISAGNPFLSAKQDYLTKRKVRKIVDEFFKYLISNPKVRLEYSLTFKDATTGFDSLFTVLEEVQGHNFMKGRILGFYKAGDKRVLPIIGYFNGDIDFSSEVSHGGGAFAKPIQFKKYTGQDGQVVLQFALSDVLDRKQAPKFNTFWHGINGTGLQVYYSSDSVRVYMDNVSIAESEIAKLTNGSKREIAKQNVLYGSESLEDLQNYLKKFLREGSITRIFKSGEDRILSLNSDRVKVVLYLDRNTAKNIKRFGIGGDVPNSWLFQKLLDNFRVFFQPLSRDEVLHLIDKEVAKDFVTDMRFFKRWMRRTHTNSIHGCLTKINEALEHNSIKFKDS